MVTPCCANPRKRNHFFSNVSPRLRRKWAIQAQKTRKTCARRLARQTRRVLDEQASKSSPLSASVSGHEDYREIPARSPSNETPYWARNPEAPEPGTHWKRLAKDLMNCEEQLEEAGREPDWTEAQIADRLADRERRRQLESRPGKLPWRTAENPGELLIMSNPCSRRHRRKTRANCGSGLIIRHKRKGANSMRRRTRSKRRNGRIMVKIGGHRRSYRSFVKYTMRRKHKGRKLTLRGVARLWRKARKYHGGAKVALCGTTARRRRGRKGRGRRSGYRALVKKFGVKRAAKKWRARSRK